MFLQPLSLIRRRPAALKVCTLAHLYAHFIDLLLLHQSLVQRLDRLCDWRHDPALASQLQELFPAEFIRASKAFDTSYGML